MKKTRTTILSCVLLAILLPVQAQNTNIDYLTLGASMNYMYEGDSDGGANGDGRSYMIDLDPTYQAAHTNYLLWKSNTMEQLIVDWTNGTLSASDQQYIQLIQADYIYRANHDRYGNVDTNHCKQYFTDTSAAGEAAMKKGYRQESLTANDWEDLRLFRILDDIQNTGTHDLPYKLDLTFAASGVKRFDIGEEAPNFRLPKLQTVLARSNYTDGVRTDPTRAFYDRGTNRYTRRFPGYTTNGAAPYVVRELEVAIPPGETTNDFVEIGSVRDKPMVLLPVQLSDGYWWEFNCHDAMPIYHAYKDVVDFYFLHLQYHDTSARGFEYFGANAGQRVCIMDMETSEELAADAKNQWMTYPWFSIPTLVDMGDSRARNALSVMGGGSSYMIIDTNGKVAYDGEKHVWNFQKKYAEDFYAGTAWANLMERELIKVLDNNGEFIPTNTVGWGDAEWTAFEIDATVADRRTARITDATVDSVDAVSNLIEISKTINSTNVSFTLEIGPNTRLSEIEQIGDLSTFAPGDTVTVKFWKDTYPSVTCTTNYRPTGESAIGNRVVAYEVSGDSGDGIIHHPRQVNKDSTLLATRKMTWLSGTLESVSSTSRQITVSVHADTNAMYGWNYWQEAGGRATLWGDAANNMGVLSQWVGAVESGSNWTFVIDDDVELFLNAENAAYDDLVVGNPIGLLYRTYQDGSQADIYPEVLRLSVSGLPGIKTDTGSLSVPEGGTNVFGVRLSLPPKATTTVTVSQTSGDTDLTVQSGASLTFTTTNWDSWQPVTLAAAEDSDGASSHAVFRCSSPTAENKDITATEADNDDLTPPTLTGAQALSGYTVEAQFSEAVERTSAQNTANYAIDNGITVRTAVRDAGDPSIVRLHVSDLAPGTYTLSVSNVTDLADNPMSPDAEPFTYSVGPTEFFSEPMDSNPGWSGTAPDQWEFGIPDWSNDDGYGANGATSAYSGTNVYAYHLDGDYEANISAPRYLTTPAIDCSSHTNITLRFYGWLGVELNTYDHANLQISSNGSSWVTLWENGSTTIDDSNWILRTYDLSAMADSQPTVYLRWGMGTSDGSWQYSGWAIDDVTLTGEGSSAGGSGGDDPDADGLPAWWEELYFGGPTNAAPAATASNGVNTLVEAYIAGLDPTDPDAAFLISELSPLTAESILQWQNVSGRVYSIYWTSNLLSGFPIQPFTNGLTDGIYTDSTHGVEQEGFYKIEVRLE